MKKIIDSFPYFFIHENIQGYQTALQKGLYGHFVVIIKDNEVIGKYSSETLLINIIELHKVLSYWLNYEPTDIEEKCKKLTEADKHLFLMRLQLLPQQPFKLTFPDLEKMEYQQFKKRIKNEQ